MVYFSCGANENTLLSVCQQNVWYFESNERLSEICVPRHGISTTIGNIATRNLDQLSVFRVLIILLSLVHRTFTISSHYFHNRVCSNSLLLSPYSTFHLVLSSLCVNTSNVLLFPTAATNLW